MADRSSASKKYAQRSKSGYEFEAAVNSAQVKKAPSIRETVAANKNKKPANNGNIYDVTGNTWGSTSKTTKSGKTFTPKNAGNTVYPGAKYNTNKGKAKSSYESAPAPQPSFFEAYTEQKKQESAKEEIPTRFVPNATKNRFASPTEKYNIFDNRFYADFSERQARNRQYNPFVAAYDDAKRNPAKPVTPGVRFVPNAGLKQEKAQETAAEVIKKAETELESSYKKLEDADKKITAYAQKHGGITQSQYDEYNTVYKQYESSYSRYKDTLKYTRDFEYLRTPVEKSISDENLKYIELGEASQDNVLNKKSVPVRELGKHAYNNVLYDIATFIDADGKRQTGIIGDRVYKEQNAVYLSQFMTDEEKLVYKYLLGRYGAERAREYITNTLNKAGTAGGTLENRSTAYDIQRRYSEIGKNRPYLSSMLEPALWVGDVVEGAVTLAKKVSGYDTTVNDNRFGLANAALNAGATESGAVGAGAVHGLVHNVPQMLVSVIPVAGPVLDVVLGALDQVGSRAGEMTASGGINAKGATLDLILEAGIGGLTWGFMGKSADKLMKGITRNMPIIRNLPDNIISKALANVGAQALSGAGIMATQTTLSNLADQVTMHEKSAYESAVRQYRSEGMSYDAAKRKAFKTIYCSSFVQSAVVGAVTGVMMHAPQIFSEPISLVNRGNLLVANNKTDEILDTAVRYGEDSYAARNAGILRQRMKDNKSVTPSMIAAQDILNSLEVSRLSNDINAISRLTGVPIEYDKNMSNKYNGRYENGRIYINPKANTDVIKTVWHELSHALDDTQGGGMSDYAKGLISKAGFTSAMAERRFAYEVNGKEYNDDVLAAEVAADFARNFSLDSKGIARLAKLAEGNSVFYTKLHNSLDWLTKRLDRHSGELFYDETTKMKVTRGELREMQELFNQALPRLRDAELGGNARYSVQYDAENKPYDDTTHTPEQLRIMAEYENAVDENLLSFVKKAKENPTDNRTVYMLNDVSDRLAEDIEHLTGIDTKGYGNTIKNNSINHIIKRHGENGIENHVMADDRDIARMQYAIDNYDTIELLPDRSMEYRNREQQPAPMIKISKRIDGTYYVVEAVPDTKRHQLAVISAYKNKAAEQQMGTAQSHDPHVRNASADTAFNDIVPQRGGVVNGEIDTSGAMYSSREMSDAAVYGFSIAQGFEDFFRYTGQKYHRNQFDSVRGTVYSDIRDAYKLYYNGYADDGYSKLTEAAELAKTAAKKQKGFSDKDFVSFFEDKIRRGMIYNASKASDMKAKQDKVHYSIAVTQYLNNLQSSEGIEPTAFGETHTENENNLRRAFDLIKNRADEAQVREQLRPVAEYLVKNGTTMDMETGAVSKRYSDAEADAAAENLVSGIINHYKMAQRANQYTDTAVGMRDMAKYNKDIEAPFRNEDYRLSEGQVKGFGDVARETIDAITDGADELTQANLYDVVNRTATELLRGTKDSELLGKVTTELYKVIYNTSDVSISKRRAAAQDILSRETAAGQRDSEAGLAAQEELRKCMQQMQLYNRFGSKAKTGVSGVAMRSGLKAQWGDEFQSELLSRMAEFTYPVADRYQSYQTASRIYAQYDNETLMNMLANKEAWTAVDTVTSILVGADFARVGDVRRSVDMMKIAQEHHTKAGQSTQAQSMMRYIVPEGRLVLFGGEMQKQTERAIRIMHPENADAYIKQYQDAVAREKDRRRQLQQDHENADPAYAEKKTTLKNKYQQEIKLAKEQKRNELKHSTYMKAISKGDDRARALELIASQVKRELKPYQGKPGYREHAMKRYNELVDEYNRNRQSAARQANQEAVTRIVEEPETAAKPETVTRIAEEPETVAKPEAVTRIVEEPETAAQPETVTHIVEEPETAAQPETVTRIVEEPETAAKPESSATEPEIPLEIDTELRDDMIRLANENEEFEQQKRAIHADAIRLRMELDHEHNGYVNNRLANGEAEPAGTYKDELLKGFGIRSVPEAEMEFFQELLKVANDFTAMDEKGEYILSDEAVIDFIMRASAMRGTAKQLLDRIAPIRDDAGNLTDFHNGMLKKALTSQLKKMGRDHFKAIATEQVFGFLDDAQPRPIGKKIRQFQYITQLSNGRTTGRNVFSTSAFHLTEALTNNIAHFLDTVVSVFTKQKTVGWQNPFSKESIKAGWNRGQQAYLESALNVDVIGINPETTVRAGRKRTFVPNGRATSFLAMMERNMGYILSVPDEFHKGMIAKQLEDGFRNIKKNFGFTDEEMMQIIEQEIQYRTFNDTTKIGTFLQNTQQSLNNLFGISPDKDGNNVFGLGNVITPYTYVPGAVLTRSIEYSPLAGIRAIAEIADMAQQYHRQKQGVKASENYRVRFGNKNDTDTGTLTQPRRMNAQQQRKLMFDIARPLTGSLLVALAYGLRKNGIIVGFSDDDEDDYKKGQYAKTKGLSKFQLNLSAIKRLVTTGHIDGTQKGDTFMGLEWLTPINSLMSIGAAAADMIGDHAGEMLPGDYFQYGTRAALDNLPKQFTDMSMFTTIYNLVRNWQNIEGFGEFMAASAGDFALTFYPSFLNQIGNVRDDKTRNPYYGESVGDIFLNKVFAKSPIMPLREQVPVKVDMFGNAVPSTTGSRIGDILENMILPGSLSTYKEDDFTRELDVLSKYSYDVLPKLAGRSYRWFVDDNPELEVTFELNNADYQDFQTLLGQASKNNMLAFMQSEDYKYLTIPQKGKQLEEIARYTTYTVRDAWYAMQMGVPVNEIQKKFQEDLDKYGKAAADMVMQAQATNYLAQDGVKIEDVVDAGKYVPYTESEKAEQIGTYKDYVKKIKNGTFYLNDMGGKSAYWSKEDRDLKIKEYENKIRDIESGAKGKWVTFTGAYNDLSDEDKEVIQNKLKYNPEQFHLPDSVRNNKQVIESSDVNVTDITGKISSGKAQEILKAMGYDVSGIEKKGSGNTALLSDIRDAVLESKSTSTQTAEKTGSSKRTWKTYSKKKYRYKKRYYKKRYYRSYKRYYKKKYYSKKRSYYSYYKKYNKNYNSGTGSSRFVAGKNQSRFKSRFNAGGSRFKPRFVPNAANTVNTVNMQYGNAANDKKYRFIPNGGKNVY